MAPTRCGHSPRITTRHARLVELFFTSRYGGVERIECHADHGEAADKEYQPIVTTPSRVSGRCMSSLYAARVEGAGTFL